MSFYSDLASTATSLLTEFGQAVTRRNYDGNGAYAPGTGSLTVSYTDTARYGAIFDAGSIGKTNIAGGLVQTGDKRLLVDAAAAVKLSDHFIVDGIEYAVVSAGEINPAGTVVLYDLHVRR